jgi:hypothetical protein
MWAGSSWSWVRCDPAELIPATGFKANLREDTGEVLGIVSDEYEVYLQPGVI